MGTGNSIQWRSTGVIMRSFYDMKRQESYHLALLQVPGDTADRKLQSRKIRVTLIVTEVCMHAPQLLRPRTL